MSDFNLQITVRNARLLRAIREQYGSAANLCRATGMHQSHVSALLTMRAQPFRQDGALTAQAEALVSALGIPADDLWPAHIARLKAKAARVEIEMDAPTFAAIADDNPERRAIHRQAIARWTRGLSAREKDAMCAMIAGSTLEECGQQLGGITRERVRQIVALAERKVRRAALKDGVRSFAEIQE